MRQRIQEIDNHLIKYISENLRSDRLDGVMRMITKLGDFGLVWFIIAAIFISTKKYRSDGVLLLAVLLFCGFLGNTVLKPYLKRLRPCNKDKSAVMLIRRPSDYSLPSGHAMTSFAAATVICYVNSRFGIAAICLAMLISYSRVYLYVHYPSDVFVGMLLGVGLSVLMIAVLPTILCLRTGYTRV